MMSHEEWSSEGSREEREDDSYFGKDSADPGYEIESFNGAR